MEKLEKFSTYNLSINNPSIFPTKKIKNYCINCNKEIHKTSIRCRSCYQRERFKKCKSNSYIDGRTLKKYYCIDCGKRISLHSGFYSGKRCRSCANRITSSGNRSPNWIDGRSYEKYPKEFNQSLRDKIRERDNYICRGCEMTQEEHFIVYSRDLEIHHIDYNRKNCKEDNLITLCKQCNIRANKNRDYWEQLFKEKLIEVRKGYENG